MVERDALARQAGGEEPTGGGGILDETIDLVDLSPGDGSPLCGPGVAVAEEFGHLGDPEAGGPATSPIDSTD